MTRSILLATALWLATAAGAQGETAVRFEAYVTAHQVEQLLASDESRNEALARFQDLGISKVFLETVRSGFKPSAETLTAARDFFRGRGLEVSGAVATTNGNDFGVASNQPGIWLNYQSEKTQADMAEHFRWIAGLFDELMIDDFFATDDESEISAEARGDRSWSEYRLELMMEFAARHVIAPAREANPDVQLILKFPQWYDRFHKFGYDAALAHTLFDRIWVGTETRNPETQRFGFTMPTMGYINYSWLAGLSGDKIGGGWYDFGDCTPETYLMQGYQTVLAGAREIVLFEAGGIVSDNPCLEPFKRRRHAVEALGAVIGNRRALGIPAYKPPRGEGSDEAGAGNLYVYDYLATLGLPAVPVAEPPPAGANAVFLARQAAGAPGIADNVREWLNHDAQVFVTPDFLAAVGDDELTRLAGFEPPFVLSGEEAAVNGFGAGAVNLRVIPMPADGSVLALGETALGPVPILTRKRFERGEVLTLNLHTYRHGEFAPDREQFLPPRPLTIKNWPDAIVNQIHRAARFPYGFEIIGRNNEGVYFFEDNLLVLANFNHEPIVQQIRPPAGSGIEPRLHQAFPHAEGAELRPSEGPYRSHAVTAVIPPWELAVIEWDIAAAE